MADERDKPSGPQATVVGRPKITKPPVAEAPTQAAPSGPPAGPETRLTPPSLEAHRSAAVSASSSASRPAPSGRSHSNSKVGEEIRAVTIDRFDTMASSRFELLDELARGGLGRVFRARDPRTNRIVAIKEVLNPHPEIIVRFAREAIVTANLQHPSIVPVYEVGRWENGEPYYAMKLVKGRTLDDIIREAKTTAARVALVPHVIAVADALAYAHSESVIHRDLKPSNVLVGAYGETVVIDWGLAKNLATGEELDAVPYATTLPPDSGETVAGSVLGTPAYMPPEQAHGDPLDEHADVYAIGAILYHALSGVRPYAEQLTLEDLMQAVRNVPPRPLAELAPDVPPELIAIVGKAMARDQPARYATADGLAQDLRSYQAGKLVAAHHYTSGALVSRWIRQHRGLVGTAAIAAVVLIAFAAVSFSRISAERDEANRQGELARTERTAALAARELAERRFADSLDELARQALHEGAADRALALLGGELAARPGGGPPTLGVLAAQARAAYGGLVGFVPPEHAGTTTAQVTRDGARLYTVSADGIARGWDLTAQKQLWRADGASLFELSPDEKWLGGVSGSGALEVRAPDTGALVVTLPATAADLKERANAVQWAADNEHFAAITPTGHVFVGARGATRVIEAEPHANAAYGLAYAPDGQHFATGGADGVTLVHDAATGATVARIIDDGAAPGTQIYAVAWASADLLLTGDNKHSIRVWSLATKSIVHRLVQPDEIVGFAVGDGWVACFGAGAVVTLWDEATWTLRAQLPGHRIGTDYAASDGTNLVTTDESGGIYLWDPATGERLAAIPAEGTAVGISVHGERVAAFSRGRTRVFHFAHDGVLRRVPGHTARIRDLQFAADGTLWSASNDGTARGYDPVSGKTVVLGPTPGAAPFSEPPVIALGGPPRAPNPHGLRSLTVGPDGSIATAAQDGALTLWDAKSGAVRATWTGHTGRVRQVVFATDGKTAFSIGDTTVRKWDVATGKELAHGDLDGPGWGVLLFDQGRQVATLTEANQLVVWSSADLTRITHAPLHDVLQDLVAVGDDLLVGAPSRIFLVGHDGDVPHDITVIDARATSATRTVLAAASANNEIGLYDPQTLALVRSWHAPDYQQAVRLRPDGAILATASQHRVLLWDTATGSLVGESPELPAQLATLAWSSDGLRLAAAGGAGTIWIWELSPGDLQRLPAFARCVSPWRLADAALVATVPEPASCAGQVAVHALASSR